MKAAIATGTQDIDKHIHIKTDLPKPTLATYIDGKTGKLVSALDDGHMIVKVLSCALAPMFASSGARLTLHNFPSLDGHTLSEAMYAV